MQVVFLLYEGMTALDVVGPHEILCRLPGAVVKRVALQAGPLRTDSAGLQLIAEEALCDVSHADILLIPGGGSARTLREYPDILEWVRTIHSTTRWTTSVCTGSLILGAAGILNGLKATTHWAAMERLTSFGAIATKLRIVEEGKIMTAAGVSAGIDMALHLVAKISGEVVAQSLQLGIEYDPEPPFDVGSVEKASPLIREAMRARLQAAFETDPSEAGK